MRVTAVGCGLLVALAAGCDLYFEDDSDSGGDPCGEPPVAYEMYNLLPARSLDAARAVAMDFDGDGNRENNLAEILFDIEQATTWRRPDLALAPWWLEIRECDGAEVVTAVDAPFAGSVPARGSVDGYRYSVRDGAGPVPLTAMAEYVEPVDWRLGIGLQINVDILNDRGRLGFAIWQYDIEEVLAPALGIALTRAAAADPSCIDQRCWFDEWDTSIDGLIEGWEVLRHPIGRRLAEPDLDLLDADNRWAPNADGVPDSHSFSVQGF